MNNDINTTLAALVPILRMSGEKVASIEAVHDWYKVVGGRKYMKEVAEITYDNGYRRYADIGSDSNLTACYDVLAVIQDLKPPTAVIERIERGVYPAAVPDMNVGKMEPVDVSKTENAGGWMERNKDMILQAGLEGREVEFRIGGRLFAIREKAQ